MTVLLAWQNKRIPPIVYRVVGPLPAVVTLPILGKQRNGDLGPTRFVLTAEKDPDGRAVYLEDR